MVPVLRNILHVSNEAYGRIVSALGFGMMTGEFPVGALMDRLDCQLGLTAVIGRQFIMPEFWHTKSLSPTRFIH